MVCLICARTIFCPCQETQPRTTGYQVGIYRQTGLTLPDFYCPLSKRRERGWASGVTRILSQKTTGGCAKRGIAF